jgi:hypothetical protein
MSQFERSIDIALKTDSPEMPQGTIIVVPIKSTESLVAARGLGVHLRLIHNKVSKNAGPARALDAVYEFISEDVEDFRLRADNIRRALEPEVETHGSRAYAAAAISYLLRGSRAHKKGVWLKGKIAEEQLVDTFRDVMGTDELTFDDYSRWAYTQSIKNGIYWRRQLETIRYEPIISQLREAIDRSDHYLEV